MNGIFLTQSGSLRMFYELMKALREPLRLDRIGFYVSHSPYFSRFARQVPDIESGNYHLLKEWEITSSGIHRAPDLELIRAYEQKLGNPQLWGPLVADRHLYLGRGATFKQDYRTQFNHRQMLGVLETGLVETERFFDKVQPDFVASFICVTFGEYLAYLIAESRGIQFLNLRPTRIANYTTYGDSIFEPTERVRAAYHRHLAGQGANGWAEEARRHVDFVRAEHARYDGNVGMSVPKLAPRVPRPSRLPGAIFRTLRTEYRSRFGKTLDTQAQSVLAPLLNALVKPLRVRWQLARLSADYVAESELSSLDYVLFPLHVEPEVTQLVYASPYLNQIEVVRNVSRSIPVGMTLLVKEHPAAVGKRTLSYYRKLLEIPNVRLADPAIPSRPAVENARLVANIAGSMGWEAVLRQKPVVLFGRTPYEFLPSSMVRRVTDLEHLGDDIADLMENYRYQEEAVTAYVEATMSESVPVNLYTTLLGRGGYSIEPDTAGTDEAWKRDIARLAQYTVDTIERSKRGGAEVRAERVEHENRPG